MSKKDMTYWTFSDAALVLLNLPVKNFQAMQGTIKTYTAYTLNAFKEVATANVDKVTLEFGVTVAGEGGVPYITKGSAECNLKITVECSFSK